VSRGELTPDEAQTVAAVVAAPKAIIETQELERRLLALEERLARGERPPPPPEREDPA
jgi:hypothetical protein